jgi:hypothetical protein
VASAWLGVAAPEPEEDELEPEPEEDDDDVEPEPEEEDEGGEEEPPPPPEQAASKTLAHIAAIDLRIPPPLVTGILPVALVCSMMRKTSYRL